MPDWVIIPGGNLGNVSALGSGFDMMYELGVIQKTWTVPVEFHPQELDAAVAEAKARGSQGP